MPLRNDGPPRRPMPRQLDIRDWSGDLSSTTRDGDYARNAFRVSREVDDIKMREESNPVDSFRVHEYWTRQLSTKDESQRSYKDRDSSSSEFDVNRSSSDQGTSRRDVSESRLNSRDVIRGGSTMPTYKNDRHDNQREEIEEFSGGEHFGSSRRSQQERWRSDHSSHDNLRRTSDDFTRFSSYTATGDSYSSHTSFDYDRSEHHADSRILKLNDKAHSIREAEVPRGPVAGKVSRNTDGDPTHKRLELKTSSIASGFDNQDGHRSPTNSVISTPPVSPEYDGDSVAQRIQNRYPKSSISSRVFSDQSTTRRTRPSSACSSISTTMTTRRPCSLISTKRTNHDDTNGQVSQSKLSDLREDLYSFHKQMREIFIRVEDMVDAHRSLFKSDPSTGSPNFNSELQQEAEKLATDAFEQLAQLRSHFTRLAKDFQRSEQTTGNWVTPNQSRRTQDSEVRRHLKTRQSLILASDQDNNDTKSSDIVENSDSDRLSVTSDNNDEVSTREQPPSIRTSSHVDSDEDVPTTSMQDSMHSTSTYLSSQLQWRKNSSESIANSDISARMRTRPSNVVSAVSSIPDQNTKISESDTDIFKDFDKRMEEIRCSLNAIASGKNPNPNNVVVPRKNFTTGSPVRAMMDARRIRSSGTCRTARVFREEDGRPQPNARETELRQLLQELNSINADDADDV